MWSIEYTDEFEKWWDNLTKAERKSSLTAIELLKQKGINLPFPYSSKIKGSTHEHMRELRFQHKGKPYRILYIFDPRRTGILLVGGNKTGNDRWYKKMIPLADRLYEEHLKAKRSKTWQQNPSKH